MIGQTIAHYTITAKLGSGGMGEVFLAEDTKLDRKVALKFLPDSLSKDPEARERLIREAKAASKLNYSNIVTIHAVEHVDDRYFIVMEYVDGRPLDEFLSEKPRSLDEVLRIAVQIGRALEHAHKAGIVHRDLKPGNIFIDRDDRIRILDFGLARLPGSKKLTQTGSTLGTISYMSPEQVEGKDADERSDQFSFGILLYEMLAGQAPFAGDHHAAIMYAILNETPKPLTDFRSDLPPAIVGIVAKSLQKSPNSRYTSTSDLVAELRRERDARTSGPSQVHVPVQPQRKSPLRLVLPAIAIVAILIVLFVLKPWSVDISPTQEAEAMADRLAVMYFDNLKDPDDPERYGEIASTVLIADLSESQHMQVVSSQRLYDILKQLGREGQKTVDRDIATQVASKAQAKWMLMGTILQTEPHFVITSQLVESESGTSIASQMLEGNDGESIFSLVGRLASEITSDLSIPETSDAGASMTIEASASTEAYRHYLNGVDLERRYYYLEANEEFKRAITLDSTFAMAYIRLFARGNGSSEELQFWLSQAKRYSDRLGRRDRLLVESVLAGREEGGQTLVAHLEKIHQEFPDDIEVMEFLATQYRNWDRQTDAVSTLKRIIAIDSLHKNAYNQLAYTYDQMGETEESLNAINRYIQLAPDEANPYDSRGDLYGNHGKIAEARSSYARAVTINPNFIPSSNKFGYASILLRDFHAAESCFTAMTTHTDREARSLGRIGLAVIQGHQGRLRKAINILDAGIEADRMEQYTGWSYMQKMIRRFSILFALEDNDLALTALREIGETSQQLTPHGWEWTLNYEALIEDRQGNPARADSILSKRFELVMSRDTSNIGNFYYGRLLLATQRGEQDQIRAYIDSLRQRTGTSNPDYWSKNAMAQGFLALSQPADAIPILENILTDFDVVGVRDVDSYIPTYYDLARAYEMSGWTDKAIERYEHFLELWPDPDPELTIVDSAKAHIAALKQGTS